MLRIIRFAAAFRGSHPGDETHSLARRSFSGQPFGQEE
jgi:hypothetical protein